jgi:hypothetical protein
LVGKAHRPETCRSVAEKQVTRGVNGRVFPIASSGLMAASGLRG